MNDRPFGDSLVKKVVIDNQRGLHARAAARFVQIAAKYDAEITVTKDGETVSGHSILDLITLAAGRGSELTLLAEGPEAAASLAALVDLVGNRFDER